MVFIPGGRFIMGVPPDEPDNREEERPHHYVTVPSFYMGKYPVTQAEWRAVARLPKVSIELESDPSYDKDAELPVEQVDWHDAVEFCQRLSAHSQRDYRLPSEAEWEYACRANDTIPPHVRETLVSYMQTLGVVFYPPGNAFGLHDMQHGQGEWCQDTWHANYQGAPNDGSAWREGGDPAYRVKRGGFSLKRYCSVYRRHRVDPDDCYWDLGFRVCCSVP
jgi:formylglycine-generating enzyme required for sulfatase activity